MKTSSTSLVLVFTLLVMPHCGPGDSPAPGLDPEETFTAFCETLFTCPDVGAMLDYGSQEGCEDVHRMNYDDRDSTCRVRVLMLEDCLSDRTCQEIDDYVEVRGSACDDERSHLSELCTPL